RVDFPELGYCLRVRDVLPPDRSRRPNIAHAGISGSWDSRVGLFKPQPDEHQGLRLLATSPQICDPSITRQGRAPMSKESSQAALGTSAEAVNTGKFDLFDQVVDPNCIDHAPADGQVRSAAGYRMFFSGMRAAFPDLSVTPEAIVQDEDTIAIAYTLTGTLNGPLGKILPSGKKVKIRGMQISKFKDGKMVERWGSSDERTLLKQIGVIPD